ncbi:MAG: Uncharacterised protein [Flavobacterium sp. SCGC AAA160-P02]|nr:MAG: Uncharacterised protein [Flavobacterium sp. SCGC AAA160-P02]|tara:strand:- start:12 stop:734 length:723 start_codon:yes stop_codon:yes gene_type:complete
MNIERYTNLIENSEVFREESISELKSIVRKYPFFQSARALYLKGLKQQGSFRYNNELKITASYTTDRSVLFDFITSKSFEKQADIHQQISQKISTQEVFDQKEETPINEKEFILGTPIHFSKNETHSFQQWLQLSVQKPIRRKSLEVNTEKSSNDFLIDRFIEKNPKISSANKNVNTSIQIAKNKSNKSLMTETLAKVYLEQKKFSEAIKAYEILRLKYPEKSGFFADQIKRIKDLKNKL